MLKHLLVLRVPSRFLLTKSLRPLSALTSNCSISSSHSYSTSSSNEKTNQEPKAKEDQEQSENLHDEKVIELKEVIVKKDLEIVELKDLYRRALADAENVRIRTAKELVQKSAYAIQSFAKDLLSTADILELALKSVPENDRGELGNKELKALWTGVSLTKKELLKVFGQHGITEFNPIGEKFDFNFHTALFQSSMPDKEPGTVFHVDKVGYKIKDRILRPASVGVVKDTNDS